MSAGPDTADLLAALRASGDRLLAVANGADLRTAVPACPDWDLAGLLTHLGGLWYFHGANVRRGVIDPPTANRPEPPDDRAGLVGWAAEGFEFLFAALSDLSPEAPAWNWGRQPPVVRFWQRRMAHEALVHRRDGEQALHARLTPYGPLATDAVDELLAVFVPRSLHRTPWQGPAGPVLVHATDSSASWRVEVGEGTDVAVHPVGAGEGAGQDGAESTAATVLRGTAEQLVLALWGREALEPLLASGDPQLARALVVE